MTIRELCEKEVVQLEQGVCLGRADDLAFDPATARLQSLILLGRPRLFGLLGREPDHSVAGDRDHRHRRSAGAYPAALGCALEARAVAEPARKAGALSRFYKKRVIFL